MQEGADNIENEINALRMEIDNIAQGQNPDGEEDESYTYVFQDTLNNDIPSTNFSSGTLELMAYPNPNGTTTDELFHPEDSKETRERLRNALRINREYQNFLTNQMRQIKQDIHRNEEMQRKCRILIAQREKPPTKRGQSNSLRRVPGNPYFFDQEGLRPPDNKDTIELKPELEKTALMYRFKKWSKGELASLANGIRKQNSEQKFSRLIKELENNRITHERFDAEHAAIRRIPDADLEKESVESMANKVKTANLNSMFADIDWEEISSVVGSSRTAADCKITWTNAESPNVNKSPWTKEEDTKLVKIAKKYQGFQWEAVARELGTHRAPVQCLRRYQRNLNTNIMKAAWTAEEDAILSEAVKKFGVGNWQQVANFLVGRTGQQCLHRWDKTLRPTIKKGRWNSEEDKLLREAVERVGSTKSWIKISQYVPGRTDMQCRERWVNILNPDLNRTVWHADEDERLRHAIAMFGLGKWAQVATVVISRTDNQCWRRWKSLNPDVVDDYREAIGAKKSKKKHAPKPPSEEPSSSTAPVPSAEEPDEQELKRLAKRRKTDSKNSRKVSKALNDGIQSAMEPEEPIRVFPQDSDVVMPPPQPPTETQFNVTLEPTPAKKRGRPPRRMSFPQPRTVGTAPPSTSASPATPNSPTMPATQASPAMPAPQVTPARAAAPSPPVRQPPPTQFINVQPPTTPAPRTAPAKPTAQTNAPAIPAPANAPVTPAQAAAESPSKATPISARRRTSKPAKLIAKVPARRKIIDEDEDEDDEESEDDSEDSNFGDEPDKEEEESEDEDEEEEEEEAEEEDDDGEVDETYEESGKKRRRRGRAPESTLPVVFPSPAVYVALYRLFDSLDICKENTTTSTDRQNNNNNNNNSAITITNPQLIDSFKNNPEFKLLAAWFNSLFLCSMLVVHEGKSASDEADK